jgi:hypothetical protein
MKRQRAPPLVDEEPPSRARVFAVWFPPRRRLRKRGGVPTFIRCSGIIITVVIILVIVIVIIIIIITNASATATAAAAATTFVSSLAAA